MCFGTWVLTFSKSVTTEAGNWYWLQSKFGCYQMLSLFLATDNNNVDHLQKIYFHISDSAGRKPVSKKSEVLNFQALKTETLSSHIQIRRMVPALPYTVIIISSFSHIPSNILPKKIESNQTFSWKSVLFVADKLVYFLTQSQGMKYNCTLAQLVLNSHVYKCAWEQMQQATSKEKTV